MRIFIVEFCYNLATIGSENINTNAYLREAARNFRESKISKEKSNFFLFYQNIPFCELVSKKIF